MSRSYKMTEVRSIAQRLAAGAKSAEVAAEFGRTAKAIDAMASRNRHLCPKRDPSSRRRIDDAQAKAMREAGMKLREIAKAFEVSECAIFKALKRAA